MLHRFWIQYIIWNGCFLTALLSIEILAALSPLPYAYTIMVTTLCNFATLSANCRFQDEKYPTLKCFIAVTHCCWFVYCQFFYKCTQLVEASRNSVIHDSSLCTYVCMYFALQSRLVSNFQRARTFTVLLEDNCCNIWISILAHKVLLSTNSKQTWHTACEKSRSRLQLLRSYSGYDTC